MANTDIGSPDPATTFAAEPGDVAAGPAAGRTPGAGIWRRRRGWLIVAVPAAVSFVLGGYQIGGASLWRDEAYTKDAIARPFGQIFVLLGHQDAVHGAYYLLMHVVAAVLGTSAAALRFPSLCAMVIATGFVAATGRRAAALALAPDAGRNGRGLDVPALTGLLSGLLFATAPYMTYYAQMARSYAIETMFAVIASYLLLRAWPDGRWRWWLGYAAAVALTGLFNIFGLLIVAAHGITLLLTDARGQTAPGRRIGRIPSPAALAGRVRGRGDRARAAARPGQPPAGADRLAAPAHAQRDGAAAHQPRRLPAADRTVRAARAGRPAHRLAGGPLAAAQPGRDRAAVAGRPAVRAGRGVVRQAGVLRALHRVLPAGAGHPGRRGADRADQAGGGHAAALVATGPLAAGPLRLAWLPAVLAVAVLAALLAGPQQAIRQTAARPDNLRLASAIVAAHEQPGDVVFYLPATMHVLGTAYPAPFARLRDIALNKSAIASGTLTGTEITSPARLKSRFTDVRRVWVVTGASTYKFPRASTPMGKEKLALLAGAGMRILHRWQAGEVMLTLYGT